MSLKYLSNVTSIHKWKEKLNEWINVGNAPQSGRMVGDEKTNLKIKKALMDFFLQIKYAIQLLEMNA
jgi:hypothetical protein